MEAARKSKFRILCPLLKGLQPIPYKILKLPFNGSNMSGSQTSMSSEQKHGSVVGLLSIIAAWA